MEAIVYEEFGGPEVLRHVTGFAVPEPGPGEVRVRVAAAGVNPVDWKRRYGWVEEFYPTVFPVVPGLEFAGTVEAVGPGVTEPAVGDEVFGWSRTGAYAAYAVADAGLVVPKPAGLSWEAAAGLPVAAETARQALERLGVREGGTLFLHGAAGAVGSVAAQLAVAAGITVVGSASPANHAFLRELGAVPVTYGDGLDGRVREAAPGGRVDAVLDAAGHGVLPVALGLVGGDTGRIVTIAAPDAAEHGVEFLGMVPEPGTVRGPLAEAARRAATGELRLRQAEALPLKEAAQAQTLSENGHAPGKLTLLP